MTRSRTLLLTLTLLLILVAASATFAQNDGRINPPSVHFGGDVLYCNKTDGCTLLNKDGQLVHNWSQASIEAARASGNDLATVDPLPPGQWISSSSGIPMFLEVETTQRRVASNVICQFRATFGCDPIPATSFYMCFTAYDEHYKPNAMCFEVTEDWNYIPLGVPAAVQSVTVPDCSMWNVGDWVGLTSDYNTYGVISSINTATGEVTFSNIGGAYETITAKCDAIVAIA